MHFITFGNCPICSYFAEFFLSEGILNSGKFLVAFFFSFLEQLLSQFNFNLLRLVTFKNSKLDI